jgi:hypothetical protein
VTHIISVALIKGWMQYFCSLKAHPRLNNSINYYTPHVWVAAPATINPILLVVVNLFFKHPRDFKKTQSFFMGSCTDVADSPGEKYY